MARIEDKMDGSENVVELLQSAVAEANGVKDQLAEGGEQDYVLTLEALNDRYQQVISAAQEAIAGEYRSRGALNSAKVCEINNGMDDYALTVQGVMALIRELEGRD